jgi:hypothetical protein
LFHKKIKAMRSKKTNRQVRNTIKVTTGIEGIKKTLELPGSVDLKQNKNWIDAWIRQNEKIRKVKTAPVSVAVTPGIILKWWEN